MVKKKDVYVKITILVGLILITTYILQSNTFQFYYEGGKELGYRNSEVQANDLVLLQRYLKWQNRLLEDENSNAEEESNRVSLPVNPTKLQRDSIKNKPESRGSTVASKEKKGKISVKMDRVHKADVKKNRINYTKGTNSPIAQEISAKKPEDEEDPAEKSGINKQERSSGSHSTTYLNIPFGYDQIQNRLNSLVHKGDASDPTRSSVTVTGGSMHQLILDETRTNTGGEFFEAFNKHWQSLPIKTDYTITVSEKPLPSVGTMVIVKVNNEIVYQRRLNPNNQYISWTAGEAIMYAQQKLQNQKIMGY